MQDIPNFIQREATFMAKVAHQEDLLDMLDARLEAIIQRADRLMQCAVTVCPVDED